MDDLVARLKTDVQWHRRRGNETIARDCEEAAEEIERLRRILNSRPAVNAGLPDTYMAWTQGIYELEMARTLGIVDAAIRNTASRSGGKGDGS